ncbi:hypothetical protein VTI74DRAFT_8959 [Chaetomium olivicolor]
MDGATAHSLPLRVPSFRHWRQTVGITLTNANPALCQLAALRNVTWFCSACLGCDPWGRRSQLWPSTNKVRKGWKSVTRVANLTACSRACLSKFRYNADRFAA